MGATQMALYIMRQTLFVLYHVHVIELIFPGPAKVYAKRCDRADFPPN